MGHSHSTHADPSHLHPGNYHRIPTEDHSEDYGHASPFKVYLNTFVALLVLTVITVAVTRFDFGLFNVVVALGIASIKAMLVALFFMHLKHENPTTWLYALFPLILLAILIGGVFIDNPYRSHPADARPIVGPAPSEGGHGTGHH